jgi:hypothetical protein
MGDNSSRRWLTPSMPIDRGAKALSLAIPETLLATARRGDRTPGPGRLNIAGWSAPTCGRTGISARIGPVTGDAGAQFDIEVYDARLR